MQIKQNDKTLGAHWKEEQNIQSKQINVQLYVQLNQTIHLGCFLSA